MNSENDKLVQAIEIQNQGRVEEAALLFREILAGNPDSAAAIYSLGVILLNKGDIAEALPLCEHGVKVAPNFAPLRFVYGAALQAVGRKEEALQSFDEALRIQPDYMEVLINSGVLLRDMFRHKDALERFNRALTINPDYVPALSNAGILLTEFKESEKAIALFERLLRIKPDYDYGLGLLCYERLHICNWTDFENLSRKTIEGVRAGQRACKSLALMSISDSASDHLLAARTFAQHYCPRKPQSLWQGERYQHKKIRVAYVSPDLREHPVGHLMAGIFEHHDKSRFETIAISLGIDDQSRLRARMLKAFDRFIDARHMSAAQIAQLMRDLEVDVAIDLGGYTSDTRTEIFAYRPVPVQVNYLGYPGTMGTDYMDYILADRHVIPEEQRQFFSEKVAYLPDAYLPTDASVKISERTPTRAECGLPEEGVVFCSFNHDYKISPPIFDIWMRLLKQVPGSVLWLMSRSEPSQRNLRNEASLRGVDPSRLVFANRVPLVEDHLARYRQADMFLDTHPYNAHTTAADALMAGLPVVTYTGSAFPSRVAGSLLHAVGLPELVTHSLADYEALALKLATTPAMLKEIKERLQVNRKNQPLFDTGMLCRNLEAAYIEMWNRYQNGAAPIHFAVSRSHQTGGLDSTSSRSVIDEGREAETGVTFQPYEGRNESKDMKIKIKNDITISVPRDLSLMTPYILLEQEDWFESEIKFIRHLLKPGMQVIDVGANYGTYTITAAKQVGERGGVLAFEPASKTADYLKQSIALNSLGNIRLMQCALSDHNGEATLSISDNSELNTLQQTAGANSEVVRLRTLDDCYKEARPGPIDFFKLDAEGEEIRILAGANQFLAEQSPLFMFELKHGSEVNVGLIEKFEQLGYRIFILVPGINMLAPFDSTAAIDPFQLNLFACKNDRAEMLERDGFLAMDGGVELPASHSDKNLWMSFAEGKAYGSSFGSHFENLCESETGDWPLYRSALNDYACSKITTFSTRQRVAYLARSLETLSALLGGKSASFPRLCTWIRVAADAGKRGIAASISVALLNAIDAGQIPVEVNEPFLPPTDRYDLLDPGADMAGWCLSSVLETVVIHGHFSSYFSGEASLPVLERLAGSRYQSPEMERRRQLVRIRSGRQQAPEKSPVLGVAGPDNLNEEFWATSGNQLA